MIETTERYEGRIEGLEAVLDGLRKLSDENESRFTIWRWCVREIISNIERGINKSIDKQRGLLFKLRRRQIHVDSN